MPKGGARPGAGRKATAGVPRDQHQVRATSDEWQIIKAFADMVKNGDKDKCKNFVAQHKLN